MCNNMQRRKKQVKVQVKMNKKSDLRKRLRRKRALRSLWLLPPAKPTSLKV